MSQVARVTNIPTKNIEPNPHNPRRLFDEEPMKILKESIKKLGVLVPVGVYPKKVGKTDSYRDAFVLLDGERRWRCAKVLDMKNIPCIVIEQPSEVENILTMFHIHNVRESWQLMPTALKLHTLMEKLGTKNEDKLAELTKLTLSQVRRCKVLLSYPKKYQNMMLAPVSERFKADFFIDLDRFRRPALENKLRPWVKRGDSKCIDIMVSKYENNVIKAVTEFRNLKSIYQGSIKRKKLKSFTQEIERFLDTPDMGIADIQVSGVGFEKEITTISASTLRLYKQIEKTDFDNIATDKKLIERLRNLSTLINSKLEKAFLNRPDKEG